MGFRTNPDRILENIDRQRSREAEGPRSESDRQATGRELDTEVLDPATATTTERTRRIFRAVERAYMKAAQGAELGRLAARFQTVGDIPHHHARGDVIVSIHWMDSDRDDDVGVIPFEVHPDQLVEARKTTRTSRPDVNGMKVLREKLRQGVMAGYRKIEPRVRDAIRERADLGHVSVRVTMDLRPAR